MKTAFITLFTILIIVCLYLFGANAYIYHRIGAANLVYPDINHDYVIAGKKGTKVYAALGDSLTAGVGVADYTHAYPYDVAQDLAEKGAITLKVFAYPGITSTGLINNYLSPAIKSNPDIVTVMIGTNDIHNWISATEFEAKYRQILSTLTTQTHATVYAISIPYIGSRAIVWPPLNFYFDYETNTLNRIIERLAAEYGVTCIDIATPTKALFKKDNALYAADSFHPSALGYKLWADIIYANIHQ